MRQVRPTQSWACLILERHLPAQHLVYLASLRRVEQDRPLAAGQPTTQVKLDSEMSPAGRPIVCLAMDMHLDFFCLDALVGRDRSQGEDDSTAQGGGDQFAGAGIGASVVVTPPDGNLPVANVHLGAVLDIVYVNDVICHKFIVKREKSAYMRGARS